MKISSFETFPDRRLGYRPDHTNLLLFAVDDRGLESVVGTLLGFEDRKTAVEAGLDIVEGRMAFVGGRFAA